MSDTYTAVYERDGDAWTGKIAEAPHVSTRGANVAEVRSSVRDALAQWLKTDADELHVVDDFRMPAAIRSARQVVQETRTDDDRSQMMASMTDEKSATEWAEELGIADRDPVTVEWLKKMGDQPIAIDSLCHTITMVEEMYRLTAGKDTPLPRNVLDEI